MYFVLLPAKGNEEILRKLRKTQFWAFFAIFDKSEFFRYVSKEKNLLKGKSEESKVTKQIGSLRGTVRPLNGVKGAGVKPWKILDFHDFHMPREAILDLLSS